MKKEGEKKFSNRGRGRTSCLNLSLADCSSLDYEYEAKHPKYLTWLHIIALHLPA